MGLAARRRAEGMSWHEVAGTMLQLYDGPLSSEPRKAAAS